MLPEPNIHPSGGGGASIRRSDLPIEELREGIVEALSTGNRLIVEAPTGSGKSTQIPQMLLDAGILGSGRAVILQPRRLAARMLAARVAHERDGRVGDEVGYRIRLDDASSSGTRLLFVTEGILVRQMLGDPDLHGVSALLFDEFHERHLYSDISLAQALALQATRRPDLKIIVMSATLDTSALAEYLQPCDVLRSGGRTHPVEIDYLSRDPGDEKPWDLAADAAQEMLRKTTGNLLVFMPGAYEIARTISTLRVRLPSNIAALPLHGELTPADQDAAVSSGGGRKVIVATNVAETS
ncbi:MAG: DEAD/DEAH box helicase, partial [Verrucomicrobiota bacterium]